MVPSPLSVPLGVEQPRNTKRPALAMIWSRIWGSLAISWCGKIPYCCLGAMTRHAPDGDEMPVKSLIVVEGRDFEMSRRRQTNGAVRPGTSSSFLCHQDMESRCRWKLQEARSRRSWRVRVQPWCVHVLDDDDRRKR